MIEPIKVCHLTTLTGRGGVEMMLLDLLRNARSPEVEHMVLATSASEELFAELKQTGVKVFRPQKAMRYDPRAIWQMARWLRQEKVDIIHSYNCRANCWAGIARTLSGTPVHIVGEHGTIWTTRPPMLWLERLFYKRAHLVVANSEASKLMIEHRHGITSEKIIVVYNGVAPLSKRTNEHSNDFRKKLSINPDEKVVGTIGRLSESKDFFSWLDTAKILADKYNYVRFIIVGGGPLADALKQYASKLGILSQVIFTGWRRDAMNILEIFDVYLSSSIHESFGNSLVEAAYCKKTVVAPRIDGIPDVVIDGKTGLLSTPDADIPYSLRKQQAALVPRVVIDGEVRHVKAISPYKMAQKVSFLLENLDYCQKLGETAYHRAVDNYSISRYVANIESLYISYCSDIKVSK